MLKYACGPEVLASRNKEIGLYPLAFENIWEGAAEYGAYSTIQIQWHLIS